MTRRAVTMVGRVVLTVALLTLLAATIWDRRGELVELVEHPPREVATIAALVVLGHFVNSAEYWVLYRAQGVAALGVVENWMVFTAGQLGNLLPGQVGSIYKFRYMKTVHDLDFARSGSNYGANLVISFASSSIAGLVGLAATRLGGEDASAWLLLAFGGLGVLSVVLLALPVPDVPMLRGRPARAWRGFRDGWDELRRQPRIAAWVLALDLSKYAVVALRFQLAFSLLEVDEPLPYFFVIAPAAGLAGAIAITPGALGFREVFVTAAAVGMGSDLDTGLLAATVDRGVLLTSSLVLGGAGLAWTTRRMRTISRAPAPPPARSSGAGAPPSPPG